ncbi:acyl carrier protein [Blautia liquoris]|uniref:Acyl carrier protein n=2 Tax=Blautia liquoris TaxID=2779518 RepID=A0A7M2RLK4_9FIRM|nr:acyl carrier protein [Blautia liquoris]
MDTLMNILTEIDSSIVWDQENALIDDRMLDSFDIISLVSEMEGAFDIEIEASEMVPDNFNSVEAMRKMIVRLQGS